MDLFLTAVAAPPNIQQELMDWFKDGDFSSDHHAPSHLRFYFQYYAQQICQALHNDSQHLSANKHQDIINIGRLFKENMAKDVMKQILASQYQDPKPNMADNLCESSIDLAVRALLMVSIGELQNGFSGRRPILWKHGTVQDFPLEEVFPSNPVLSTEGTRLSAMFVACNLERIAGFEIVWTANLADHLRMIDEDKKLFMFHHVSYLQQQQQ